MNIKSSQISIIVPVYNSENFLKNCIESILNQTYTNFELILIDDGSLDRSPYICDEYSQKDSRIKVIYKENEGPGMARNCGLDIAKGEYIAFVDSDDVIHPQFLEILLYAIQSGDYDLAMCDNYQLKNREIHIQNLQCKNLQFKVFSQEEMFKKIFSDWRYIVVWGKLYKKEIVNEKRFLNQYYSEDWEFNTFYSLNSKNNIFINHKLYFQGQEEGSLTRSSVKVNFSDHINALYSAFLIIPENKKFFSAIILDILYNDIIYFRNNKNLNKNKDNIRLVKNIYTKTKITYFKNENIPLRNKFLYILFSSVFLYKIYLFLYLPTKFFLKNFLKIN